MAESTLEPLRETALPLLGTNKIWCNDIQHIRDYPNLNKYGSSSYRNNDSLLSYITTRSNTSTINNSTRLLNAYNNQFPTLIREKQNTSAITTLLTNMVTKDIYVRINDMLRSVYSAENIVYNAFDNTEFDAFSQNNLSNSLENGYRGFFSNNEVVNIFELQTPYSTNTANSGETTITSDVSYPLKPRNSNETYITSQGIETRKILFSSYGLNESLVFTSSFNNKTLIELATADNTRQNFLVENKPLYEYVRDFGLETIIHSKMLSSFASNRTDILERKMSSGFIVTRDNFNTITGLIFYATLIIPRPYMRNESTRTLNINSSFHSVPTTADRTNAANIQTERSNNPNSRFNTNERKQYIAISSRFNLFDLVEYYPIRRNIIDSNLITILANTFNTINGVNNFNFTINDNRWQLGLKSEYATLKCISSYRNPIWDGKLISECNLPEHTNVDYPAYIFRLISSINSQFEIKSLVDGQRIVSVEELGDDKYMVVINIIVVNRINNDGTTTKEYSFQTKETQYNNLFPATILNSDVEINGELIVKNITGNELMRIDPIKNTTNFFTKVGINQPSYETNSYLDINNLSRPKLTTFINDVAEVIKRNTVYANNINTGNVNDIMSNNITNVNSNDIVVNIPLRQYKTVAIPPLQIDRAARMNIFTARIEGPFVALEMERIVTKIAEANAKIYANYKNVRVLLEEMAYYERLELFLVIAMVVLDVVAIVAGGAMVGSFIAEVVAETIISTIQNIDWVSIAKGQSDIIGDAANNLDTDSDEYDSGSEVCQALIDVVNSNTTSLSAEITRLQAEYEVLKLRLVTFAELNVRSNTITQNHTRTTTINGQLLTLEKEQTILNYILINQHNVVTYTTDVNSDDVSRNVVSSTKESVIGIIMGDELFKTITTDQVSTYTNLLADTTNIETFKTQYIDKLAATLTVVTGNDPVTNDDKTSLLTMYNYAANISVNSIDSTNLIVNVNNTSVLTYIRTTYLPWIVRRIEGLNNEKSQLRNKTTQFIFDRPVTSSPQIQAAENTRTNATTELAVKRPNVDYLSKLRDGMTGIYHSGMGDHHMLGVQIGYFHPDLQSGGKYHTRFYDQIGGFTGWISSARGVANHFYNNRATIWETQINTDSARILVLEQLVITANTFLASANVDELQKMTQEFGFNDDSHNKIRNYLNNIWQLYEYTQYTSIAQDEKYTIYANLTDKDESNMYVINIEILYRNDQTRPSALMTCSYLNTDNYINDLSYRSKYFEITDEINGTSELVNYSTVIFKKYLTEIIRGTKTISEIISGDNLFPNRFNSNSYITVDNITDSKVVCDEVNTNWNNQSFDNIIISGTNATLNDVYTNMYTSFIQTYTEITFNYNYLVEYVVNGVTKLSIIRYIKVSKDNTKIVNTTDPSLYNVYRITSNIDVESIIVKGMTINGDAYVDGNFYVNVDDDTTTGPLFTIDVYNKTNTSKLKLGLGKVPTTVLDITDTTLSNIVKMDYNTSNDLYILNEVIEYGRFRSNNQMRKKLIEYINENPDNKSYFYLHEFPEPNATTGKFDAKDLKLFYYGKDVSWNGLTYNEIMNRYPSIREHIETNILPSFQQVLDDYLLYNKAICTTSNTFTDGITIDYYRIIDRVSDGTMKPTLMISFETKVNDYNIDPTYTASMTNVIEYTRKQTRFMNYVKKINNVTNIIRDNSGNEVNVRNVNENKTAVDAITTNSILDDINVYIIYDNTDPTISKVNSITQIREDLSNNNVNSAVNYSRIVPNNLEASIISEQIASLTYANGREHPMAFVEELLKQYEYDIIGVRAKTDDVGMVVYKVGSTYYRSMYYLIKRSGVTFVYSFYMNYSNHIGNHVNINGDTRMEGKLSLINDYNNTSHVTINPFNNYFGINTEEMSINYADKYITTSSIYNASHNLVVYNNKYPNAVFARSTESATDTTYKYFGSYSGLTVQRASNLYVYDNSSSFMDNVRSNNSQNYGITNGLMTYNNWNNYKHYGADISFELRNRNGLTKELGQVKMVIDKIDENNNICTGFGVQVVDNTVNSENIEEKVKNLMYVNSDRQLFVDGVVLGGKLLKVDGSGNLVWGETTIVAAPTP